jgi:hypothetical protein
MGGTDDEGLNVLKFDDDDDDQDADIIVRLQLHGMPLPQTEEADVTTQFRGIFVHPGPHVL